MAEELGDGVKADRLVSGRAVLVVVGGEMGRSSLKAPDDSRSCELDECSVEEKDSGGDRRLPCGSDGVPRGTREKVLSACTAMKLRRRDSGRGVDEVGEVGEAEEAQSS